MAERQMIEKESDFSQKKWAPELRWVGQNTYRFKKASILINIWVEKM